MRTARGTDTAVFLLGLTAIVVLAAATAACALAPGFTVLLAARAAQGLAVPFVFAVAVAYVAEEVPASRSAAVNGLYVSGTAAGGFLGRFLSGAVADASGWRASFAALGLVLLVVLGGVGALLPRERRVPPPAAAAPGVRRVRR